MKEEDLYKLKLNPGDLVEIWYQNKLAKNPRLDRGFFRGYEHGIVKLAFDKPPTSPIGLVEEIVNVVLERQINFMPYLIEDIIEIKKVSVGKLTDII